MRCINSSARSHTAAIMGARNPVNYAPAERRYARIRHNSHTYTRRRMAKGPPLYRMQHVIHFINVHRSVCARLVSGRTGAYNNTCTNAAAHTLREFMPTKGEISHLGQGNRVPCVAASSGWDKNERMYHAADAKSTGASPRFSWHFECNYFPVQDNLILVINIYNYRETYLGIFKMSIRNIAKLQ